MSAPATPPVPAGWYPDPEQPTRGRYWDGSAWTENYHDPTKPAAPLTAPPGTDGNTPWIWLIIGLQVLPLLSMLLVPWGSVFDFDANDAYASMTASFALFLSPFYWLTVVLGWVVYGVSAYLAYRDHRELAARGVPRPFHWAFVFISSIVYVFGRAVVVKRRTGRGSAPLWAEVGYLVLSVIVTIIVMAIVLNGMVTLITEVSRTR